MKVLVLTTEPISAQQLREALPGEMDPSEVEAMVVAPALQESAVRFWMSDADDAIARADEVRRRSVEQLGEDGVAATGDTGEGDLVAAAADALTTFPAERIVLFVHREEDQRYREDVDEGELRERFGLEVDRAEVAPAAG